LVNLKTCFFIRYAGKEIKSMKMEDRNKHRRGRGIALGIALGIPLGIPIGLAIGNLAVGPAIGMAIGVGLGAAMEVSFREGEKHELPEVQSTGKINRYLIIGLIALGVITMVVLYLLAKFKS
jgi:hypothetical protein